MFAVWLLNSSSGFCNYDDWLFFSSQLTPWYVDVLPVCAWPHNIYVLSPGSRTTTPTTDLWKQRTRYNHNNFQQLYWFFRIPWASSGPGYSNNPSFGKIFESYHENPLHIYKSLELTMEIQEFWKNDLPFKILAMPLNTDFWASACQSIRWAMYNGYKGSTKWWNWPSVAGLSFTETRQYRNTWMAWPHINTDRTKSMKNEPVHDLFPQEVTTSQYAKAQI
jgi:hypothetical protein